MTGPRVVTPEILDGLDKEDPSACRSRRDLQRVHRVMGTRSILRGALLQHGVDRPRGVPLRVLELGAGDGTLMLGVAERICARWPPVKLTLLDRIDLVAPATRAGFERLGWNAATEVDDVLQWAEQPPQSVDLIIANLFLHHFEAHQLRKLLLAIASCSRAFFACEPRRSSMSLIASRLIGLIGANAVTRADSVASVRAGFANDEISTLWPINHRSWNVREYSAGLFSHCFHAWRQGNGGSAIEQAR